jgi:hypothetical protein
VVLVISAALVVAAAIPRGGSLTVNLQLTTDSG